MEKWIRALRDRADLVALAALILAIALLPGRIPGGVYGLGVVAGAGLALHALGVVLVYRSNRIVNFAQVQVGVLTGVLFRLLVEQQTLARGLRAVCAPCMPGGSGGRALAYWASLVVALAVAAGLSYLIEAFVVRRFADAPRLVLTVATIGVAQLLASLHAALPGLLATEAQRELNRLPVGPAAPPPLEVSLGWSPAIFRAPDIFTVVAAVVAVALLFLTLAYSERGVLIRASAENPQRATTLGIDVAAANRRVWIVAGLLAGVAGVLGAMNTPAPAAAPFDAALMVRILAAAVIASMTSLPLAALGALVLGVFDQALLWVFGSSAVVDGLLTAVIAVVLLLRRARVSRVEDELASAWRAAREARPVPAVLRALPAVRAWTRWGATALVVLTLATPFLLSPTQANAFTLTLVFGVVALSLLVLSGWAGQISLGQFALAGIGAYVAALSAEHAGLPMVAALAVGALAGAAVAVAVGLPALRLRGLNLAITTLAVALTTSSLVLSPAYLGAAIPDTLSRGSVLGVDLNDHRAYYYFTLVVLAGVTAAVVGLRRSRFGRSLIATRDNEAAAESFGTSVVRVRLGAFAFSGGLAGLAGALYAFHQFGLEPASFTPDVSVAMFLMAVIGGLGSIVGVLLGALYLGVLTMLSVSPLVLFLATGGGVVALLLLLPGGLGQFAFDLRDAVLVRIARRHRIEVPSLAGGTLQGVSDRAPISPHGTTEPVPWRYRLRERWAPEANA